MMNNMYNQKREIKGERDIDLTWFGNLPMSKGESGYIFLFFKPGLINNIYIGKP